GSKPGSGGAECPAATRMLRVSGWFSDSLLGLCTRLAPPWREFACGDAHQGLGYDAKPLWWPGGSATPIRASAASHSHFVV
ncbi:MAG TPA: hypothetical protein PLB78_10440, partial [Anaerolineae bacterium]|nr:hypothetical protein [Anaerolineae bacterium]